MRGSRIGIAAIIIVAILVPSVSGLFNFGTDKFYIYSTTDGKAWNLISNPSTISFSKPTTYKVAVENSIDSKSVINGIYIQTLKDATVIVKADFTGKNVGFVQYNTEKYEGYYSYGGGSVPWTVCWQVYPKSGTLVYSDFSKKQVSITKVSEKWIDTYIKTPTGAGSVPKLVDIQVIVGV